jgi:hypothetical protein
MATPIGMKRTAKKKPLNKVSKKPTKALKKKVWDMFSIYIRLRDCLKTTGSKEYGECITCDKNLPFKELQAGHFIAGRHNGNLFSERGVHAQCRSCNIIKHGNQLEYRRAVVELYGEGADLELEEEARQTKRYSYQDLEELLKHYTEEVKKLKAL